MKIHITPHDLAGQAVTVRSGPYRDNICVVEDWWDRISGRSWKDSKGNQASLEYALRQAEDGLPTDDDVVYGKINQLGKLLHQSEMA